MVVSSIESFWNVCHKSQLLAAGQLAEARKHCESIDDPLRAANWLVERGLLTKWQASQLLAGRYGFFIGKYRLLERLGSGGMGQVFKAQQVNVGRTVALKLMSEKMFADPRAIARFLREMQAVASLHHPNIIKAFDADCLDGCYFLVMEYVPGRDLGRYLKKFTRLPIDWSCECIRQAALGLDHAHAHGMVHRDIKPSNLLVSPGVGRMPAVKILDLGMARIAEPPEGQAALTQLGQILGTVDYISPEQARNASVVDTRSDIYSLGCTLYTMLTGQVPFPGQSTVERLMARAIAPVPKASVLRPELPARVDEILARMLARDPAERFQTPAEVVEALGQMLSTAVDAPTVETELPASHGGLSSGPESVDDFASAAGDAELKEFLSRMTHDGAGETCISADRTAAEPAQNEIAAQEPEFAPTRAAASVALEAAGEPGSTASITLDPAIHRALQTEEVAAGISAVHERRFGRISIPWLLACAVPLGLLLIVLLYWAIPPSGSAVRMPPRPWPNSDDVTAPRALNTKNSSLRRETEHRAARSGKSLR